MVLKIVQFLVISLFILLTNFIMYLHFLYHFTVWHVCGVPHISLGSHSLLHMCRHQQLISSGEIHHLPDEPDDAAANNRLPVPSRD